MLALGLGLAALVVLVLVVGGVLVVGTRQAREEQGPSSRPDDFVAPVSSGGFRWRQADESPEEFKARVARDSAAPPSPPLPPPPSGT